MMTRELRSNPGQGTFTDLKVSLVVSSIIEARSVDEVIYLVGQTPFAPAKGAIETREMMSMNNLRSDPLIGLISIALLRRGKRFVDSEVRKRPTQVHLFRHSFSNTCSAVWWRPVGNNGQSYCGRAQRMDTFMSRVKYLRSMRCVG